MGLLDTISSLFSGKKTKIPSTPVEPVSQIQNTPQQTTPATDTATTLPQTPIEEPASVKSIDDLLKETENKLQIEVNNLATQTQNSTPQAPVNPAEPAPGIGTTHTNNSLHANKTISSKDENSEVRDISL